MSLKEVSVKWGRAVYYKTHDSNDVKSIPLTVVLKDEDVAIVDNVIRQYLAEHMRTLLTSQKPKYELEIHSSLPAKALGIPSQKFVNAQRILNWSIYIISQVINSPSIFFYSRDPKISIPSSNYNMNDILKRIMSMCQKENEDLNMSQLLSVISAKMFKLFNQKKRKLEGGKKTAVVVMENEISRCVQSVYKMLYQYRDEILQNIMKSSSCSATKKFMQLCQRDIPVYLNTNISFSVLFHTTGEILNTLFIDIISQLSMTDAMNASIFYLLYLHEVDLLEEFLYQINLPILNRLILACFPHPSPPPSSESLPPLPLTKLPRLDGQIKDLENWIKEREDIVFSELNDIIKKKDDYDDDTLYWSINKERGNTLEYYLIVILRQYIQVLNLSSSSRHDRHLNRRLEMMSLWKVFVCFYHYVVNIPPEVRSVHIFSEFTFGNNPMYKKIIHHALQTFISHQEK